MSFWEESQVGNFIFWRFGLFLFCLIYLKQRFPKKKFWANDLHFNLFKIQADKKTSGITAGCVSKFPSSPHPHLKTRLLQTKR
ncbi:MAG: hypothetical protein CRN43_18940 [Candidatus Nephrothrix sp. EaCA]|nr:MAG: hypothetical protein CRN43_18940 [Candidatus Nephrothrix sp. EaCA]